MTSLSQKRRGQPYRSKDMHILKYHVVALAAALGLSSLIFAITLS